MSIRRATNLDAIVEVKPQVRRRLSALAVMVEVAPFVLPQSVSVFTPFLRLSRETTYGAERMGQPPP